MKTKKEIYSFMILNSIRPSRRKDVYSRVNSGGISDTAYIKSKFYVEGVNWTSWLVTVANAVTNRKFPREQLERILRLVPSFHPDCSYQIYQTLYNYNKDMVEITSLKPFSNIRPARL
jgi:hypothetical protein